MALFASSPIITTTAVLGRNQDSTAFPFAAVPEAMTLYVRFIELGSVLTGGSPAVLYIGGSTLLPHCALGVVAGVYVMQHVNLATVTASAAIAPTLGNTVELRGLLNANGSVQLGQSINGAAEVVTAASAGNTFAQAWGLASLDFITAPGFVALERVAIVRGIQPLLTMQRLAMVA